MQTRSLTWLTNTTLAATSRGDFELHALFNNDQRTQTAVSSVGKTAYDRRVSLQLTHSVLPTNDIDWSSTMYSSELLPFDSTAPKHCIRGGNGGVKSRGYSIPYVGSLNSRMVTRVQ